jgi:hypothetical protein
VVYTNGILLPNKDELFWKTMKQANAEIMITQYPINFGYDKVEELIKGHGIKLGYASDSGKETKTLSHVALDISGKQNAEKQFLMCSQANSCTVLRHGKIYPCSIAGNIEAFNAYFGEKLEITEKDYIDIYKVNTVGEILDFLTRPIPFCRYCDKHGSKWDLKWGTSDKDINEWAVRG